MLGEARRLATADTTFLIGADLDDPAAAEYASIRDPAAGIIVQFGPRRGLAAWTNFLAGSCFTPPLATQRFRALASLGDDHVPRTEGWDSLLLAALDAMGGTGIAYPDDKRRSDIPEAAVISADIVRSLGWMCEPTLNHFYVDNVWADIARGAGCLAYVPGVVIEHVHYLTRPQLATRDATYAEAEAGGARDQQAYEHWRSARMAADIATVRALREQAA
jgi:hypothetical protein